MSTLPPHSRVRTLVSLTLQTHEGRFEVAAGAVGTVSFQHSASIRVWLDNPRYNVLLGDGEWEAIERIDDAYKEVQ